MLTQRHFKAKFEKSDLVDGHSQLDGHSLQAPMEQHASDMDTFGL